MLQRIGDTLKGHQWLTYVLFGGLTLIFAAWGAYGIANLHFGSSNDAVKVNGQPIPQEEVRRAWLLQQSQWEQRFGGAEIPAPIKSQLQNQLVEQFVRNAVIAQHTRQLGYRVSDSELAEAVRSEPAFQLEGQYSPEVAKAKLAQVGISEDQYEGDLRDGLRRAALENGIRDSSFVTPAEAKRIGALESEERQIRYLVLPLEKFAPAVTIDDAAVQAYYKQHEAQFLTPESVNVQYAELRLAQVAAQIALSDADVRDYYDKNKAKYVVPERRDARHILITVDAKRDAATAEKRAQEVLAKLKSGGDFAALAKQYSDDSGSASKGGELGWSERGDLVGPFADALFSMTANEIKGPVKTEYGYHIIQLQGVQPGQSKTLEQARPEIEAALRHDRAADRFGDIQEQIQQRIDQSGASIESLAKEFGMQLGNVPNYLRGSGGGALGDSREVQEAVFSDATLAEHRIGGPILVGEDRLLLVRDLEHHAPTARPLAEVRDGIVAQLRKERSEQAAAAAGQAAVQKLQAGASFDQVASGLGMTAQAARFVGRTDPSVPADIRDAAFVAAKPQAHPVFRSLPLKDGGIGVLEVSAAREGPQPTAAMQANTRREEGERQGAQDATAYLEQLRAGANVQKNPQLFEQ